MKDSMLSHYRIVDELGRGGMGIVYRAKDTKLDREVAIKVLPASVLSSDDDRARFHREAKAAAALNHPNIASIYEIDDADGERPFIAMEFIDGETLDARVKKGPLKIKEAVDIAYQVASALGAAHEKGIVHRDIKSANIMLTSKGVPKVLDFGLAQTAASTKLTRMGSTLGTVAYMSPEQARGEEIDARTDLWALGVTLYELVAGVSPFPGDYEQAVVYAILNTDPEPLTALRTGVPMELERIVNKLLSKQRDIRYQSAADLMADLKGMETRGSGVTQASMKAYSGAASVTMAAQATPSTVRGPLMIAAGMVLGLVLATAAFLTLSGDEAPAPRAVAARIALPPGVTLEPGRSAPLALERRGVALSPDGSTLVIVGSFGETTALYRRNMSAITFDRIPGTEGAYGVAFSPDGLRVAFYANNRLKTVNLDGGTPRDLTDVSLPYGLVWLPDDTLLFLNAEGGRLERIPANGGESEVLAVRTADSEQRLFERPMNPVDVLPNGNVVGDSDTGLYELDPATGLATRMAYSGGFAMAGANRTMIYKDGKGLSLVRIHPETMTPDGPAITLTDSLLGYREASSQVATDLMGNVVFVRGPDLRQTRLSWLDPETGVMDVIDAFEPQAFNAFHISPDGQRLAISVDGITSSEIWNYDLERGTRTMVSAGGVNNTPVWSPDGSSIYYGNVSEDGRYLLRVPAGGLVAPDTLPTPRAAPEWMTADGEILGVTRRTQNQYGLGYVRTADPQDIITIADQPGVTEVLSRLSRSGEFVAYTSNASGDYQIYVQPFPPTGDVWQISIGGGEEPVWSVDDRTLYFRNGNELFRVRVTVDGGKPTFSRPESVFRGPFENVGGYSYDISPTDGRLLVLLTAASPQPITHLDVILNYPALIVDN